MARSTYRIKTLFKKFFFDSRFLACWVILGLLIPNIVLSFTEGWFWIESIIGFLVPAGTYFILMSAGKRVGLTTWLMLPFMIFAAFQLVLLHLYGRGLIAVDMFLNVFTTNVAEATSLLSNLIGALCVIAFLYLGALIWGTVAIVKHLNLPWEFRRILFSIGLTGVICGTGMAIYVYITDPAYNFINTTFPINVVDNLIEAQQRTRQYARYHETSADFSYHAKSEAPADRRELYIMIIGETSRGENWQLGGYERDTNPLLCRDDKLQYFKRSFSESNTTHKSVPMLISPATAETFDSIYRYKSILTAFKEAGYKTAFFTNQTPNRSYTQFFSEEADNVDYISAEELEETPYDTELLPLVRKEIAKGNAKQFIILHTYGSHFKYTDRYPPSASFFKPDEIIDAELGFRNNLINAYDNSIRYTDTFINELIKIVSEANCRACIIYSSDHGEDIFDDEREMFLHSSPVPSARQLHVATLCWLSDSLVSQNPEALINLKNNKDKFISPQKSLFNTVIDVASIKTPYYKKSYSLVSKEYKEPQPIYVTDKNEAIPWSNIQFKKTDIEYLNKHIHPNIIHETSYNIENDIESFPKKIVTKRTTED